MVGADAPEPESFSCSHPKLPMLKLVSQKVSNTLPRVGGRDSRRVPRPARRLHGVVRPRQAEGLPRGRARSLRGAGRQEATPRRGRAVGGGLNPLGPGDYYGAVRINFANASVDISDFFESADVSFEAGMGLEEVGTMRVKRATGPLDLGDLVSGPENKSIVVDSTVLSVEVVNDTVEMMRDDEVTNTFAFTQAVIFHLEKGDLVVDRNVWFEVFLSACVTSDARKFIRDTEKDWNRGAGKYHAVVKREFVLLD